MIFRDLLNLLSVKLSKVNNNKLKLFRSVQIKGQIWVRVGKFESNRNYMGRLNSRITIRDIFYLYDFFYNRNFQKIKIDSVISDILIGPIDTFFIAHNLTNQVGQINLQDRKKRIF